VANKRRCAKCGSEELKVFPDDFPASGASKAKWPNNKVGLAGGPDPGRRILVCTSCGHNQDVSIADL
jgi:hypothetical protein